MWPNSLLVSSVDCNNLGALEKDVKDFVIPVSTWLMFQDGKEDLARHNDGQLHCSWFLGLGFVGFLFIMVNIAEF